MPVGPHDPNTPHLVHQLAKDVLLRLAGGGAEHNRLLVIRRRYPGDDESLVPVSRLPHNSFQPKVLVRERVVRQDKRANGVSRGVLGGTRRGSKLHGDGAVLREWVRGKQGGMGPACCRCQV